MEYFSNMNNIVLTFLFIINAKKFAEEKRTINNRCQYVI